MIVPKEAATSLKTGKSSALKQVTSFWTRTKQTKYLKSMEQMSLPRMKCDWNTASGWRIAIRMYSRIAAMQKYMEMVDKPRVKKEIARPCDAGKS